MELLKKFEEFVLERGHVSVDIAFSNTDKQWTGAMEMHDYTEDIEATTLEDLFDTFLMEAELYPDNDEKEWGTKSKALKQLEHTWKNIQEHCGVKVALVSILAEAYNRSTPFVAMWKIDNPEADSVEYYIEQGYKLKDVFNGIELRLRDYSLR